MLVQGLQERENWPGSEGERVFITEGKGRGECAREREQLVQRLVTGRKDRQGDQPTKGDLGRLGDSGSSRSLYQGPWSLS